MTGRDLLHAAAVLVAVGLAILYVAGYLRPPNAADPPSVQDCRQANRLLADHISRQTHILITRDREIRALRAELARRRSQERSL